MERKYIIVFLMGLLCLICGDDLFAQYCISLKYDSNGNRINLTVVDCDVEQRNYEKEDLNEGISFYDIDDDNDCFVFPNPNDGKFKIQIAGEESDYNEALFQLYDNKGVIIKSARFVKTINVDIVNVPAGVYLLRIIRECDISDSIIVKI